MKYLKQDHWLLIIAFGISMYYVYAFVIGQPQPRIKKKKEHWSVNPTKSEI